MKNCDEVQERLADAGVDALRGDPELAEHLAGCDDCFAIMTGLGELDNWLSEPSVAPAHLADATMRRVSDDIATQAAGIQASAPEPTLPAKPNRRRVPLSVAIGGFGLAASALLVGGLGFLVSLSSDRTSEPSTEASWAVDDRLASVLLEEEEKEFEGESSRRWFGGGENISESPTNETAQRVQAAAGGAEEMVEPASVEPRGRARDRSDAEPRPSADRPAPPSPPGEAAPARQRSNRQELAYGSGGDDFNGLRQDTGRFQADGGFGQQADGGFANFEMQLGTQTIVELESDESAGGYFADGTIGRGETGERTGRRGSSQLAAPTDELDYRGGQDEGERSFNWEDNTHQHLNGILAGLDQGITGSRSTLLSGVSPGSIGQRDSFHGNTVTLATTSSSVSMTSEFLAERDRIEGLTFRDARSYWRNTYVPGDPTLRQLEQRLGGGARAIADGATPVGQPFDAPEDAALAIYMSTDRRTAAGETRTLVQVGIQGTPRRAGRRPSMNIALVLDLTSAPQAEDARAIRELIEEFGSASDVGDRFSLIVAGRPGGVVIPAGEMRYGPATVAAQWLTGVIESPTELVDGRTLTIFSAYEEAVRIVSNGDDPTAPLGSALVWLVTPSSFGASNAGLAQRAHVAAVDGIPTSVLGVGSNISTGELESIALAGQGTRRQLNAPSEAGETVTDEISSASSVVARAVRLRIRLAPGTRLVNVIGSERLDALQSERVRQAERSIDQRLSRSMGIQSDRGEDEDGIQIVIPAFYAGDSHVILLDVLADGPGPVADVTMRFKDLVNLRNGTARSAVSLNRGELPRGPLERNVLKNLLAWELAQALRSAGALARQGDPNAAAQTLETFAQQLRDARSVLPGMAGDADVDADLNAIAAYLHALRDTSLRSRPNELADALLFSSYRELQLPNAQ